MNTCEGLGLDPPCNWCRNNPKNKESHTFCYITVFRDEIKQSGLFDMLRHVQEFPHTAPYFMVALKLYFPQYVDKAEKLLVLL
jgi:hypothetical protein